MINNDSIVTAYDEHLTLVEWLQKIEKLLANGGLKSTTLNDKGNATFSLTLTFNDNTTITSPDMTLTSVNEALEAINNDITDLKDGTTPLFETITDSHGNKRFVEGNITLNEGNRVTKNYGKWSLCGTHFMVVVNLSIASGEEESNLGNFLTLNDVPKWAVNKIIPLSGYDVDVKSCTGYSTNNLSTIVFTKAFFLTKYGDNILRILPAGNILPQTSSNSVMHIQFDLIIDNE